MDNNQQPPTWILRIFRWYCHPRLLDHIEGDLMEVYHENLNKDGKHMADLKLMADVLLLCRPGIIGRAKHSSPLTSLDMFKNYFTIGWRSTWRSKGYSLINLSGLALGMTIATIIGLWMFDELSFNKNFRNHDQIGQIYHTLHFGESIFTESSTPYPFGNEIRTNYPEYERIVMTSFEGDHILSVDDKKISCIGRFIEPEFVEMFTLDFSEGTSLLANDMHSVLVSKSMAAALVGADPVGKSIKIDNRDLLVIKGVFEDFPPNSEFHNLKLLMPIEYFFSLNDGNRKKKDSWNAFDFYCYAQLREGISFSQVQASLQRLLYDKASAEIKSIKPEGLLFPMSQWHLFSEFKEGVNVGGKIKFVWMFGAIGAFVLLLACINFTNLSTARSANRSREVGMRKVMGSVREQLMGQFLIESFLLVVLAFIASMIFVKLSLPWFNELSGKSILIPWSNPWFWIASFTFIVLTSVLSGSYPALYLSSFNPVKVLKGTFKAGPGESIPRKALVVFQFTISIGLIFGTLVVFQQVNHARNRSVGFDREGIIQVTIRTEDLAHANYNSLRTDLLATGVVEDMAGSDFPITGAAAGEASLDWEGKDPNSQPLIAINVCSHDFPKTNGFQFVEGRDFSRNFSTDSLAMVVNELAARLLTKKSAIGFKIKFGSGKVREVVGVIKDQIRWSPFSNQTPHLYLVNYKSLACLTIRFTRGADTQTALSRVEGVLKKYDPGAPFEFKFQDDDYNRLFQDEERVGKLAATFATLAIFISCIGIFGLAAFSASQRAKEIGIRKVLGASVFHVWRMLSRDFAVLVIIAVALAAPLTYYLTNNWLGQYEYRIEMSWWAFVLTGVAALILTILTVSYQSLKAAVANPVESLRSE